MGNEDSTKRSNIQKIGLMALVGALMGTGCIAPRHYAQHELMDKVREKQAIAEQRGEFIEKAGPALKYLGTSIPYLLLH